MRVAIVLGTRPDINSGSSGLAGEIAEKLGAKVIRHKRHMACYDIGVISGEKTLTLASDTRSSINSYGLCF